MSMRDKADAVTCHLNYSPGDATSCAGLLDSLRGTVVSSLSAILYILFRQLRRRKAPQLFRELQVTRTRVGCCSRTT